MKTTEIYVNDEYFYNGKEENNAVAHWHKGWLEPNGNMGIKEGHMEIYNMKNIMDGYDIQQPAVILHELAHLYQWRHGLRGSDVDQLFGEVYKKATKDGKYDNVKHWVGSTVKHYATTNYTEYFAECTEAFFSSDKFRNDMYPFNRAELKEFDKDGYDLVAKMFHIEDPDQYFACLNKTDECKSKKG